MAQNNQQGGNKLWNGIKRVGRWIRGLLKLVWKLVKLIGRLLRGIWRLITRKNRKQASQDASSQDASSQS